MATNPHFKELVHYSEDLENAIIGIMLIEPQKNSEIIAMIQDPNIFYYDENRMIYEAILELKQNYKPIDLITVSILLGKKENPNGDKWTYVTAKKMKDVVTSAHINEWCLLLVQFFLKREQIKFQTNLSNYEDPLEASHQLNETLKRAMAFKNYNDWSDMSQLMVELQNRRKQISEGKIFGIKTGIIEFDELCGGQGFQTGFHVVFSRPGMGKSAFALSVINNMVQIFF
jgi:replicative DNA helicase